MASLILEIIELICVVNYQMLMAFIGLFISSKPKDVDGEIVLITGAGSGLGRLLSLDFARRGAMVVCCDINKKGVDETVEEIKSKHGSARAYVFDCSDRKEVYACAEQIRKDVGDVTILVNNAGIVSGKKFLDTPDEMIQKTFEVNTMAHFWTTKAFLPSMMEKNHGHIVSIASAAGLGGVNGLCDYCASKFGAVGFQESLMLEMRAQNKNIYSTTICPYYINTGMFTGASSRFPRLLPMLEPEWVSAKIMDAILHNQELLLTPWILYLGMISKCIMPYSSYVAISDFLGFTKSMDTFVGRKKKD